MNKRQWLLAISPFVTVIFAFFGMWCGYKRRLVLLTLACMAWLVIATWMVQR